MFPGKTPQEVIAKNRDGNIIFYEDHWKQVSPEAKDLVMKMLARSPEDRISAQGALTHSWLTLDCNDSLCLNDAQENIRKYHNPLNENRFNVEKIKPEFSIITCSPLLISRFAGIKDSPLNLSKLDGKNASPYPSPLLTSKLPPRNPKEEEKNKVC